MAVESVHYTGKDYDHFVSLLITRWEDASEMIHNEWLSMSEDERAFETEDWPVNNDIHQHLADYVAEHGLTEDQKAQWAKLNRLVAEHAKTLREMGYRVRIPTVGKGRAVA